jgi:hypothetical protein
MDVAEGEIVVTLRDERLGRGRRIGVVAFAAGQAGVQQADVDRPARGGG